MIVPERFTRFGRCIYMKKKQNIIIAKIFCVLCLVISGVGMFTQSTLSVRGLMWALIYLGAGVAFLNVSKIQKYLSSRK